MKVGLALGSGGVRGFAHLGVLEVLEHEKIPVDVLVGSSVGAAISAMYAFRPKLAPNLTHVQQYLHSELYDATKLNYFRQSEESRKNLYDKMRILFAQGAVFATSMTKNALFSEEILRKNVQFLLPPVNIEESLIKMAVVSFDLKTGEEVLLTEGSLIEAIMASCAIPGVFPPVEKEDWLLMDGGIVNPVPCDHVRQLGADVVIGVDVTPSPDPLQTLSSSYEVAMRAGDISRHRLKSILLQEADAVISVDATDVFWADFSRFEHSVEVGRQATRQALPAIRRLMEKG